MGGNSSHTPIITVAPSPLFALLEAGVFDAALYHRLNVLLVRVTPPFQRGSPFSALVRCPTRYPVVKPIVIPRDAATLRAKALERTGRLEATSRERCRAVGNRYSHSIVTFGTEVLEAHAWNAAAGSTTHS
jgi:hypothetical protein